VTFTALELSIAVAVSLVAGVALGFALTTWWMVRRELSAAAVDSPESFEQWKARMRRKRPLRAVQGGRRA
jgi:hypothetical protein